ncbi:MAG TPA: hypothetical protein VHL30_01610 [Chlamydiales bacterium]|nr:hypothetical protein [Chlamydiales bacterium]
MAIVQVIVSFVAVPFALLAMLFVPLVTLVSHDQDTAQAYAIGFGGLAAGHLFRIPQSLIGAIFPSTLSKTLELSDLGQIQGREMLGIMQRMGGLLG